MEYSILAASLIIGVLTLACTLMHLPRIRVYREVYRNLKEEDFYIYDTTFGKWITNKDLSTIYFQDGGIQVCSGVYLFDSLVLTHISPVSAYWYNKFKKFFDGIKENSEKP